MAELESLWKRLCGNVMPGKAPDWNFTFVRPVNHPLRRIAALSCLLQRYGQIGLLQGLERLAAGVRAGAAKSLADGLQVNGDWCGIPQKCCGENPQKCHCEERSDEAISGHCAPKNVIARSPQATKQSIRRGQIAAPSVPAMTMGKAPTVLLGKGRAGEIAVNVVLPFFTAYARQNRDTGLENRVLDTYLHYPALPSNELTRYMSGIILGRGEGKLSACLQQGLIRLYHRYCRVKDCECCPVFISRKPARA
jgi:hypothetical protein